MNRTWTPILALILGASLAAQSAEPPLPATRRYSKPDMVTRPSYQAMPGYGKKVWIADGVWCNYRFVKGPRLGKSLLEVTVFDRDGQPVPGFRIDATAGIVGDTGVITQLDAPMKDRGNGCYRLPVKFTKTGKWRVTLSFSRDGKSEYSGAFTLTL